MENNEKSYYIVNSFDLEIFNTFKNSRESLNRTISLEESIYRKRYGYSFQSRFLLDLYIYCQNGFAYEFFSNQLLGKIKIVNYTKRPWDYIENHTNVEIDLSEEYDLKLIAKDPSASITEFKNGVDRYKSKYEKIGNQSVNMIRQLVSFANGDMNRYTSHQKKLYERAIAAQIQEENDKDFLDNFHRR